MFTRDHRGHDFPTKRVKVYGEIDFEIRDKYNLSEPGIRYSADLQITRSIERNRERIAEARSDSARQMRFTSRGPGTRFSTWALVQLAAPAHGAQWRAIRFVSYPHVKTNPYRVDEENIFFLVIDLSKVKRWIWIFISKHGARKNTQERTIFSVSETLETSGKIGKIRDISRILPDSSRIFPIHPESLTTKK